MEAHNEESIDSIDINEEFVKILKKIFKDYTNYIIIVNLQIVNFNFKLIVN